MSRPLDVTCALIRRQGRYLAARRADSGLWELPGGKLEPGEDLAACLEREIQEELGARVEVLERFATVEHQQVERLIRLHCFYCRLTGSEPKALEHRCIEWVTLEEMLALPLCPPDRELVAKLGLLGVE